MGIESVHNSSPLEAGLTSNAGLNDHHQAWLRDLSAPAIKVQEAEGGQAGPPDIRQLLSKGAANPSERELSEAMRKMGEAKGDAKAGLSAAEPHFKQAIAESQKSIEGITHQAEQISGVPRQVIGLQMRAKVDADRELSESIYKVDKVPQRLQGKMDIDDFRQRLQAEAQAYGKTEVGSYAFRGLQADLSEYPEVMAAANKNREALHAEPLHSMEKLFGQFGRAYTDGFGARMMYAEALKDAGRVNEAWDMTREAMKMIGKDLPKTPPGMLDV